MKIKKNILGNMNLGRIKGHLNRPEEEDLSFTRVIGVDTDGNEITFTRTLKKKYVKSEEASYKVKRKDLRQRPVRSEEYYIQKKQDALEASIKAKIIVPKYSDRTIQRIMNTLGMDEHQAIAVIHLYEYTNKIPGYIEGLQKLKTKKSTTPNNISHGRFTKKIAEPIKRQGVKRATKVLSGK